MFETKKQPIGCKQTFTFTNLWINVKNEEGIKRMHSIADEISDLVLEFGGAYTGEHGDGIVRGAWAEKMFGKKLVRYFSDVKKTFDPNSIMNPGKIFNTPPMTSNLRYGTKYKTKTFETKLDWSKETNFSSAIEKCNGVGACRKMYSGAMCPSYHATQEEEHSTRGRANALRAAISGALPFEELSSGEKQRAWLAFALAQDRKILILDESINSLDHENTDMFFRILKKVSSDGKAILMCTHNLEMVSKYADNLLILKDKTITYEGPSKQNLSQMIYS